MSARSPAYVKVRITEFCIVKVNAVTLDDAMDEVKQHGYEAISASWEPDKYEESVDLEDCD